MPEDNRGGSPADGTHGRLVALLDGHGARYKLIDHEPEGRTELVSPMRGNALSQAAKCMVVMVKIGKQRKRFVLAVVPGDARVDLDAVKALYGGTYASFASREVAERLAGSAVGTILPFSFHEELELVADPSLLKNREIFFNAARLDRSMALNTRVYEALAKPRIERIAEGRRLVEEEHGATEGSEYAINLDRAFGPLELVDVGALAGSVDDRWFNQTLVGVNDCVVRLGVMQGEFHWHRHDEEDEFFYVVDGRFLIDLKETDRTVELLPKQGFVVPRGVLHRTRAPERTVILMIEGAGVVPTGDGSGDVGDP